MTRRKEVSLIRSRLKRPGTNVPAPELHLKNPWGFCDCGGPIGHKHADLCRDARGGRLFCEPHCTVGSSVCVEPRLTSVDSENELVASILERLSQPEELKS